MNRKWLQKEGQDWVNKGIISEEQHEQIVGQYHEKKNINKILPMLASLLIGLGILTFIASNWTEIPSLIRLLMLVIAVCGFYTVGDYFMKNESISLGISLIAMGIFSFGASIFLTGQMFHLISYDASAFIYWSIPALILTYFYRSRYLFLLSLAILMIGQIYSLSNFDQFSYIVLILFVIGSGLCWLRQKDRLLTWFLSFGLLLQVVMLFVYIEIAFMWMLAVMLTLYVAVDWMQSNTYLKPIQTVVLISGWVMSIFFIYTLAEYESGWLESSQSNVFPEPYYLLPVLIILFIVSILVKIKNGQSNSHYEWLVLLPLFYIPLVGDFFYLFALFLFSIFKLWHGFSQGDKREINIGVVLFLLTTFLAYMQLAWDFMDKSLFFLFGGIMLYMLNYFLQKKKKSVLSEKEGL